MNSTAPGLDDNIHALLEAADHASSSGAPDDAARLLEQARATAPEHPAVLNALAIRAIQSGNPGAARTMLERAIAVEQKAPRLWFSLALATRAQGDAAAEMAALDRALALEPYFYLALLQKAGLLERLGKPRQAGMTYHAALSALSSIPRDTPLPASLKPAITHAQEVLKQHNSALEAFLRERMTRTRERHVAARQDRFDDCIDVLLGKKRLYVQQPTHMHFPRLPAIQFYDREDFPWLDAVEAATNDIRSELLQLLREGPEGFEPYVAKPEGAPLNQWKELNHSRKWSAFYLYREGRALNEALVRCPKTAAVLAGAPLADVPAHAPTAFFSLLEPKTRIPPHTGVTNTRLVVHLPLVVPPSCGFRVGSDVRSWERGKAWVFDDTIEHEAWNESDEPRAILIFDIWNPHLSEAERDLVRVALEGFGEFYQGESPLAAAP